MPRELGILYKPYMHLAIREDRKTQTRRIIKPGRNQSWLTAEALGKVVRMEPSADGWWTMATSDGHIGSVRSPYRVGDLLYVKEAYASPSKYIVAYKLGAECGAWMDDGNGGRFFHHHGLIIESPDYSSACRERRVVDTYGLAKYGGVPRGEFPYRYGWKSPLHMPKWAARTWLEVTGVRAERLQEISATDVFAEGVQVPISTQGVPLLCVSRMVRGHIAWEKPKESTADDIVTSWYALLWEEINGAGSWAANPWVWVYEFKRMER